MVRNSSSPRKSDRLNCLMPRFLSHPFPPLFITSLRVITEATKKFSRSSPLFFPPSLTRSRSLPLSFHPTFLLPFSLFSFAFHFLYLFLFLFFLFWANTHTLLSSHLYPHFFFCFLILFLFHFFYFSFLLFLFFYTLSYHPTFLLPALLPPSSSLLSSCPTPYQRPSPRNPGSSGNLADKQMTV